MPYARPRLKRLGLLIFAAGFFVVAVAIWAGRGVEQVWFGWPWCLSFAASALALVWFTAAPTSPHAYVLAGWLPPVAIASRAVGLIVDASPGGFVGREWRVFVGATLYLMLAALWVEWWRTLVLAWVRVEEARARAWD